jgi:hypothetical protein
VAAADSSEHGQLDPLDREYVETLAPDEREVVVSTLLRYRREPERVVGDPLPALGLLDLRDGRRVPLADLPGRRPLVLVFGSFT